MKYATVLISLITLVILAGCGAPDPAPATPDGEPSPTAPLLEPDATRPAATPTAEGYPAAPAATEEPDEYPVVEATSLPTAYPADMLVWMQQPWGTQCEDAATYAYADVADAAAALEDAGVTVQASETVALNVCQACSCPTSEHFRVQISAQDIDQAQALGWTREQ